MLCRLLGRPNTFIRSFGRYVFTSTNNELVDKLKAQKIIKTPLVEKVMRSVDRKEFVPSSYLQHAYDDNPLPIGYNATISAPHMHAFALELLHDMLVKDAKVLDVGSGSGILYNFAITNLNRTVLFSKMMMNQGKVYGIEHMKALVNTSIENIKKSHADLLEKKCIEIVEGDGRNGLPQYAPYNCIHVGAACQEVPEVLISQLANGGKLMAPIVVSEDFQELSIISKDQNGNVTRIPKFTVAFVPLAGKKDQWPYPE